MALTRSMLKGMGLTEEQVSAIIEEHVSSVNGLKDERDSYKEKLEEIPKLQKQIKDLQESVDGGEDWESKYNKEHEEFEKYKDDVANKEKQANIKSAYKQLLVDNNVGEKHIKSIMKVTDFSGMKLNKDGELAGSDKLVDAIKDEWAGFITKKSTKGADVDNPPTGGETGKTKEEIMQIKDTSERQKAIAENHELFGF